MKRYRDLNTRQNVIISFIVFVILFYVFIRYFFFNFSFLHLLYEPVGNAVSFVQKKVDIPFEYINSVNTLQKENTELNRRLEQFQFILQNYEELSQENKRLKKLLETKPIPEFKKKIAVVIGKSPDIWHKEIVINLGRKDGLKIDTSIISPWGLLGRVKSITDHTSTVLLITDNSNWVSCINNRSRQIGLLKAENNKLGQLSYLFNKSDFKQGDIIVTSGLGGVYPKGIPVGMVSRVIKKSGDDIPEINIEYLSDFEDIEEVIALIKK